MAEYWKSTPKYWCKHCSTYVKDTKFERTQHEATGRHQGNLKRFLRGIQNGHERDEREKQRAKLEVERLNRAVGGAPSSLAWGNFQSSSNAAPISTSQASVTDRKRQMAQLADLGIAIPDEYRGQLALAGEWQVVSEKPVELGEQTRREPMLSVGVRKRQLEGQEEEQEAGQTLKKNRWGSASKGYPSSSKQDLEALFAGSIPIKDEQSKPTWKEEESQQLAADNGLYYEANVKNDVFDTQDKMQAKQETVSAECSLAEQFSDQTRATTHDMPEAPEIVFKKRKAKSARPK